ncbi:Uncharacterized protein ToN1_47940 [Aromatoleum petrolei]|nr:Uncharacterized protein ToN1_47940 [Aromatoleum petrolei]
MTSMDMCIFLKVLLEESSSYLGRIAAFAGRYSNGARMRNFYTATRKIWVRLPTKDFWLNDAFNRQRLPYGFAKRWNGQQASIDALCGR